MDAVLSAVFNKTISLAKYGVKSHWVFEFKSPAIKQFSVDKRKKTKRIAADKLKDNEECLSETDKIKLVKKSFYIKYDHIKKAQEMLKLMGVPYVNSFEEAESQCAALNFLYATATEDIDYILFSGNRMLTNFSNKKEIIEIDRGEILKELNITQDQLLDLAIVLGTDYKSGGIQGIDPYTVLDDLKKFKFDMEKYVKSLEDYNDSLRKEGKPIKYHVPANFLKSRDEIKETYLEANVIDNKEFELVRQQVPQFDYNSPEMESLLKCESESINKSFKQELKIPLYWQKPKCDELKTFLKTHLLPSEYDYNERIKELELLFEYYEKFGKPVTFTDIVNKTCYRNRHYQKLRHVQTVY